MRKSSAAIALCLLLTGCGEDAQVARLMGVVRTSATSQVVAEFSFRDSGRWTVFELTAREAPSSWPLPFHAQIVSSSGKVLLDREVTDAPEIRNAFESKRITWRVDTLSGPFESNLDDKGLLPVDHALKDGEMHTLRLRFLPGAEGEYQVHVLETRRIYPWYHGT